MKGANQVKSKKAKGSAPKNATVGTKDNRQQNRVGGRGANSKACSQERLNKDNVVSFVESSSRARISSLPLVRGILIGTIVALLLVVTTVTSSSILSSSFPYSDVFVYAESTSSGNGYAEGGNLANTPRTKPTLCSDGQTFGYSDWSSLRSAIMEVNALAASAALRDDSDWVIDDYGVASPYYPAPPPKPFVICPGITIKGRNRKGAIFIDSEDIVIECDSCAIDLGGTHLSFGPNAKGAVIRGITFMGARSSSLTFHHHGAEATFEDCIWIGNAGINNAGAVADLNSTSSVSFFRCEISDSKQMPRAVGYGNPAVSSSLTIRN